MKFIKLTPNDYVDLSKINFIHIDDVEYQRDGWLKKQVVINFVCGEGKTYYLTDKEVDNLQRMLLCCGD